MGLKAAGEGKQVQLLHFYLQIIWQTILIFTTTLILWVIRLDIILIMLFSVQHKIKYGKVQGKRGVQDSNV